MKDQILLKNRPVARGVVMTLLLIAVALLIYGSTVGLRDLQTVRHEITVKGLPAQCDGLRLDLVSDTHTGSVNNGLDNLDRIVSTLSASDADIVLLGGDYVILKVLGGTFVQPKDIAARFATLARHKRTYAVLGNHDWWKNGLRVARELGAAGVKVIDNRAVRIQDRGCDFWLVGLGDLEEGHPDVAYAMAQTASAPQLPKIALMHDPKLFPRIPGDMGLSLAGHTHGGQIRIPGLSGYPAFWFKGHLERRYVDGLYAEPDGRQLFVTRGVGTSILPVRLGVPPEISQLVLRAPRP